MLKFNNGKFRIMQIADVQEQPKVNPDSIKLITLAIEKEKPDLVVFSGDQIYGLSPLFKHDSEKKVKKTISDILMPIESAGIPFAVTFGNHDRQCGISNTEQTKIYSSHKGFVSSAAFGDENDGVSFIPVCDNDNNHVFDIVLIDSNGQSATGEYEPVKENQLDSFLKQRESSKNKDGYYTPFICIQHIPTEEYFSVIKKVPFFTKGAVEGFRNHKHEFFILNEEQKNNGGFMLESPATPDVNSGEFDVLTEKGNCLALSVGHDHNNSFVAPYKGTDLIYTQGCGFNVYGPGLDRGVRIFDVNLENEEISYNTHTVTYRELTNDKLTKPLQEFVLTHIPTSMEQVKRIALLTGIAGIGITAAIASFYRKH